MDRFVKVGTKAELEDLEGGRLVEAGGQKIAIFNLGGHYYVIENTCPYRGGPLAEGMVAGDEVICPWHGSRFKHQNRCRPESTGPRGREELCSSGHRTRRRSRNRTGTGLLVRGNSEAETEQ